MKIYLASSWRNTFQPKVLKVLRNAGFVVYDFKNPAPDKHGFSWKEIEPDYENWTTKQYIKILDHPISDAGFALDFEAMQSSDICVLLLPSGRSAHIEAGYFVGANKPLYIYIPTETTEPELMYKMAFGGVFSDIGELVVALSKCT